MNKFVQIICIVLLISMSASAKGFKENVGNESDKQTIELVINGDKYLLQDVSANGYIDIYNIIGSKIKRVEVKAGICDSATTLPKGYYIIKINDSTRKIAVK